MTKEDVLNAIVDALRIQCGNFLRAAGDARAGATDGENRSESKYDTRATEANYLADGQARQAEQSARALAAFEQLAASSGGCQQVQPGALLKLRIGGEVDWYLVGPGAGGLEVSVDGEIVTVVTASSPLIQVIAGLREGDRWREGANRIERIL